MSERRLCNTDVPPVTTPPGSLRAALPDEGLCGTYRVAFLRRGARLTVALVEAESPEEAVATARWGLTLGESLEVEAIEVERSNRSVRELLA